MCRKNCNERHLLHCPHHKREMSCGCNPIWPDSHYASSMKSLSWHKNRPQKSLLRSLTLCLCLSSSLPRRNVHTSTQIKAPFLYHLWGAFAIINLHQFFIFSWQFWLVFSQQELSNFFSRRVDCGLKFSLRISGLTKSNTKPTVLAFQLIVNWRQAF